MEINLKEKLPLDILFLIRVKANEFKNQGIQEIDVNDIKDYLFLTKWKNMDSISMCDLIDDIMSLQFSDIFDYLKVKVIKEASHMNLEDFEDLIAQ